MVAVSAGDGYDEREPEIRYRPRVVAVNLSARPVWLTTLGIESVPDACGWDDRLARDVRRLDPGEPEIIEAWEHEVGFDLDRGFRGFAELATGERFVGDIE